MKYMKKRKRTTSKRNVIASLAAVVLIGAYLLFVTNKPELSVSSKYNPAKLNANLTPLVEKSNVKIGVFCCTNAYQCVQQKISDTRSACEGDRAAYITEQECRFDCVQPGKAAKEEIQSGDVLVFCCEKSKVDGATCSAKIRNASHPAPCDKIVGPKVEFSGPRDCAAACK